MPSKTKSARPAASAPSTSDVSARVEKLAAEDLARSGLSWDLALDLGMYAAEEPAVAALGHTHSAASVVFRYWDPFAEDFIPEVIFHRVRYLEDNRVGFAAATKMQRYSQPPGTTNSIYVPRIVDGAPHDWKKTLGDATQTLYFTEGEKKASAACAKNILCLGLGGVEMYRSARSGLDALPMLDKINFRGRNVGIIFDTDTPDGMKPEVLRAAKRFLDWLVLRGARPFLVTLPSSGGKVGLDDWLLTHSEADFIALQADSSFRHADATALAQAAMDYRYIIEVDRFVGDDPHLLMQTQHLDRVLGSKQITMSRLAKAKDGGGFAITKSVPTPVALADALLIWPGTERFHTMIYEPGHPRVVSRYGQDHLNLWRGWRCEYAGTDRLPSEARRAVILREWFWALDNIFGDDADARQFAEHWLHYPLKVPGAKLNTFALVSSREEGIGKSFIGHMIAKHLYGLTRPGARHAWQLSEGDLHGAFNPYMFATSFVEGDDIAAHDKKSVYERVKSFVTSDTIQINIKNTPQFMMENRCNFWLTSNDAAPFYLHEDSRRAFIHVPRRARKNQERYHALQLMFDAGEAGPTLLHYAREAYDVARFVPGTDAPMTEGKKELVLNSRTGAREWVYDMVRHSDLLTRPVATAREILALMQQEQVLGATNVDALGYHLREAGAARWGNGVQLVVRNADGSCRRERAWMLGSESELVALDRPQVEAMLATPFGYAKSAGSNVVKLKKY